MKDIKQILTKYKELFEKTKNITITIGNTIIDINNNDTEFSITFKEWSNEEQKYLTFNSIEEYKQQQILEEPEKILESLEKRLYEYINLLKVLKKNNIYTEDFKIFNYEKNKINIKFEDKDYSIEQKMKYIIELIQYIKEDNLEKILQYEKQFKKQIVKGQKITIFDFYQLLSNNEKNIKFNNKVPFKEILNVKYLKILFPYQKLEDAEIKNFLKEIKEIEEKNNISIIFDKNKIILYLNDTDYEKKYDLLKNEEITITKLIKYIKNISIEFNKTIKKDERLQTYLKFKEDNLEKIPDGFYIAKSYGYGIVTFYSKAEENTLKLNNLLIENGIKKEKIKVEYSEKGFVLRTRVPYKEIAKILSENKKTIKTNKEKILK